MSKTRKSYTVKHAKFIRCEDCGTSKHLIMDDFGNLMCRKCHKSLEADLRF